MELAFGLLLEVLAMLSVVTTVVAARQRKASFFQRLSALTAFVPVWVLTRLMPSLWGFGSWRYPWWLFAIMFFVITLASVVACFPGSRPRRIVVTIGAIFALVSLGVHPWYVYVTYWHLSWAVLIGFFLVFVPFCGLKKTSFKKTIAVVLRLLGIAMTALLVAGLSHIWTDWSVSLVAAIGVLLIVVSYWPSNMRGWFLGLGITAVVMAIAAGILFGIQPDLDYYSQRFLLGTVFVLCVTFPVIALAKRASARRVAIVVGVAIVAATTVGLLAFALGGNTPSTASTIPGSSPSPSASVSASARPSASASASTATCPITTWLITVGIPDMANGKWLKDGSSAIAAAKTDQDAKVAAMDWLNQARSYTGLLSGAAAYLLHQQVDQASLIQGSCASTKAIDLYSELASAIELSSVTPSDVPKQAYNSSTDNGAVVPASTPGISGSDLKAVKITTADGTVVYVMARCGNAATVEQPPVVPKPSPTPSSPTTPGSPTPSSCNCTNGGQAVPNPVPTPGSGSGTKPAANPTPTAMPTEGNANGYAGNSGSTPSTPPTNGGNVGAPSPTGMPSLPA